MHTVHELHTILCFSLADDAKALRKLAKANQSISILIDHLKSNAAWLLSERKEVSFEKNTHVAGRQKDKNSFDHTAQTAQCFHACLSRGEPSSILSCRS